MAFGVVFWFDFDEFHKIKRYVSHSCLSYPFWLFVLPVLAVCPTRSGCFILSYYIVLCYITFHCIVYYLVLRYITSHCIVYYLVLYYASSPCITEYIMSLIHSVGISTQRNSLWKACRFSCALPSTVMRYEVIFFSEATMKPI